MESNAHALLMREIADSDGTSKDHYSVILQALTSGLGWGYVRSQLLRVVSGADPASVRKMAVAVSKSPTTTERDLKTIFVKNLFFMQSNNDSGYTRERAVYCLLSLEQWRSNGKAQV